MWCVGDMRLPSRVQEAMQMQVEAERKKRAAVLESEGDHNFEIYVEYTVVVKTDRENSLHIWL